MDAATDMRSYTFICGCTIRFTSDSLAKWTLRRCKNHPKMAYLAQRTLADVAREKITKRLNEQ